MFPKLIRDGAGIEMPVIDLGASQTVDGTSASAQSTVIHATERSLVLIVAEDDVHILRGVNPTATANSLLIMSGGERYLPVEAGHKIAVVGGKANIAVCV